MSIEFLLHILYPQNLENSGPMAIKDPILGHVNKPNAHVISKGPEFSINYFFDKNGFRYDPSLNEKNAKVKILAIGDSFTLGAGNNYGTIWCTLLEDSLQNEGYDVEIINAGISAYNTAKESIYLERLITNISPDLVVLTFLPNDLFDNRQIIYSSDGKLKLQKMDDTIGISSRKLNLNKYNIITLLKRILYKSDWLYSKLYSLSARIHYFEFPQNKIVKNKIDITKQLFSRSLQICRKQKIKFIVLSIPQQFQVISLARGYGSGGHNVMAIDDIFEEYAKKNDFEWIKTLSFMVDNYNKDLYYRFDGHLTPLGNNVIVEKIYSSFENILQDLILENYN